MYVGDVSVALTTEVSRSRSRSRSASLSLDSVSVRSGSAQSRSRRSSSDTASLTDKASRTSKSDSGADPENVARSDAPAPVVLTKRRFALIMVGVLSSILISALESTIVTTALPTIVGDLGGLQLYGWIMVSFLLTEAVSLPIYGKCSDYFGRRLIIQVCITLFIAGSIACALAQTMVQLIIFRGIQGLGAGGLVSLALIVISDVVPARDRGKYAGMTSGTFALSFLLGPIIGGYLTDGVSWRWIFWLNLFVSIPILLVISVCLPDNINTRQPRIKVDVSGALLFVVSVSMVLIAVSTGGGLLAWDAPLTLSLLIVGSAVFIMFIINEWLFSAPIINLAIFRNRTVAICSVIYFFQDYNCIAFVNFLPLYLQICNGESSVVSGLRQLPIIFGVVISSIIGGAIMVKTGRYRFLPMVGCLMMALTLFLMITLKPHMSMVAFEAYLLIFGIGMGFLFNVILVAVQNAVPESEVAVATGSLNFIRIGGSVIGVAVYGIIFKEYLRSNYEAAGMPYNDAVASITPADIRALAPATRALVEVAFAEALRYTFFWSAPTLVFAALLAAFMPSVQLKSGAASAGGGMSSLDASFEKSI